MENQQEEIGKHLAVMVQHVLTAGSEMIKTKEMEDHDLLPFLQLYVSTQILANLNYIIMKLEEEKEEQHEQKSGRPRKKKAKV